MRVHHIAISVKDLEISSQFYKEHFGFEEINRFTKPGWTGSAIILQLHDLQLELFEFSDRVEKKDDLSNLKVIGLKHIGIQVNSVQEAYERLKDKNVDIDKPNKGTICTAYCFLRDPDGIPLELYEPL